MTMSRFFGFMTLALGAVLLIAPAAPAKDAQAAAKTSSAKTPPASAERVDDNTYVEKSDGKTWTWRKTPFGWVKGDETRETAAVQKAAAPEETTRVSQKGDTVYFEKNNPFGASKWSRKVSELEGWEKKAWESWKSGQTETKEAK